MANLTKAVERAYRGGTSALPQPSSSSPSSEGSTALPTLSEWSMRVKRLRASLTVRDVFGLMLCAVPGRCGRCITPPPEM